VASLVKATLTDAFRQHAVFATTDVTSISRRNAAIKKAIDEVTTANEQQLNAEATFEDFSAMSDTLYTVGHKLAQDFTNIAWEEAGFMSSMSMEDAKKRVAAEKLKAVIKQLANPPNMADPVLVRADNDSKMLKLHAAATEALVPWDAEQFRALVKQHGPQTSIYTTVLLGKTPAELGANFEDGAKWAHGWKDQMSNMATMAQFTSKQQTQRALAAPTTVTAIAPQQSRPSPTATAAPIETTSKCGRCRQADHATAVCPTQGCQICNAKPAGHLDRNCPEKYCSGCTNKKVRECTIAGHKEERAEKEKRIVGMKTPSSKYLVAVCMPVEAMATYCLATNKGPTGEATVATVHGRINASANVVRMALDSYAKPHMMTEDVVPPNAKRAQVAVTISRVSRDKRITESTQATVQIARQDGSTVETTEEFLITDRIPNNADVLLGFEAVRHIGIAASPTSFKLGQPGDMVETDLAPDHASTSQYAAVTTILSSHKHTCTNVHRGEVSCKAFKSKHRNVSWSSSVVEPTTTTRRARSKSPRPRPSGNAMAASAAAQTTAAELANNLANPSWNAAEEAAF
jgi:hypothetical protein